MKVYRTPSSLIKKVREIKREGRKIGFVPTMGSLHEGHASLIKAARRDVDCVIVSIFVNPAQFGPREDFKKYPRNLKRDIALCEKEGVDIIFSPEVTYIYPDGYTTYVNVEKITDTLCGASRPGHFKGVSTIVAKLFNIVSPDIAYFGQKDAQQAIVIKRMTEDLNMSVKIKIMPTIREKDGLAMSSRNIYLNKEERESAGCIYKALQIAKGLFNSGERDSGKIINRIKRVVNSRDNVKIDYATIVDTKKLESMKKISGEALIAIAVKIGNTRLIDNIIVNVKV
jgi:pantoate--beta-alanine ligase